MSSSRDIYQLAEQAWVEAEQGPKSTSLHGVGEPYVAERYQSQQQQTKVAREMT